MTIESGFEIRFQRGTRRVCTAFVATLALNVLFWGDAAVLKAEWLISLTEGSSSWDH